MWTTTWRRAFVVGAMALATAASGADAEPSSDLLLVWTDPGLALSGGTARRTQLEVVSQLREWGVSALWREADAATVLPTSTLRVVVLDRATLGVVGSHVLGTASLPGDVGPTAWVLLPNVTRLLERDATRGIVPDSRLARALARVALHEVIHLLAPGLGHARRGLMRARLQPADLVGPFITLDVRSREALLEGVAGREPRAAVARGL